MNIENLEEGMEVKNYKKLCELLELPVKNGKARKTQIKEIERHMKYNTNGHKIIIEKIYSQPKEKVDNRSLGNNSLFGIESQKLILDLLVRNDNNTLFLSTCRLLKALEIINDNYAICRQNIPKLSKLIEMDEKYIYDFYTSTHGTLKSALETTLNQLQKKSLIFWNKIITVCIETAYVESNDMNKTKIIKKSDNRKTIKYRVNKDYRPATDDEIELILSTEREVLDIMGFDNKQDVFLAFKWNEYNKLVMDQLYDKANIVYYYSSYKIISNKHHVLKELENIKKMHLQMILNTKVSCRLLVNADKRQNTSQDNIYIDDYRDKDLMRAKEEYIENNHKLINLLIDWTTEKIDLNK